MSKQITLGLKLTTKRTRKQVFLDEMNAVVPWPALVALIEPHSPRAKTGRPPFALETMLRIHFMQQWFGLSDPAMEEALFDVPMYREFALLPDGAVRLPDESTILRFGETSGFRHLLEKHALSSQMFALVNELLSSRGLMLKTGSAIDATLISAPSSTKNASGERDPEMHQTKKGSNWYFVRWRASRCARPPQAASCGACAPCGMKAHIGVDAESGLVHHVVTTPANVHDLHAVDQLLHGQEQHVFADSGYRGIQRWSSREDVDWGIATAPGKRRKLDLADEIDAMREKVEKIKASIRAKVEHPFRVIKRQFGYNKARYRGLMKNGAQVLTLFMLSNLWMARRSLQA